MQTKPLVTLPDNLEEAHAMIRALSEDVQQLSSRMDYLLRRLFGTRSEKMDPDQLLIEAFTGQAQPEAPPAEETQQDAPPAPAKRNGHGRKRLARDLPRKRVVHDIPEAQKVCPNGHKRVQIGEDLSEQLDYIPASLYVIEHVRPVYACTAPDCDCGVRQAAKPAQPIEKGLAAPGLLAHVIVSKYCDHLPLHRMERIFMRHGVELSRKTLCGWVLQTAQVLKPLMDAMREAVLQSVVIHTDDTPVQVQDKEKNRRTRKAYLWPYVGDAGHPYTVYDYTPTRGREGPEAFLKNFTGTAEQPRYLQCDAFPGYNGLFTPDRHLFEVACWAHARRKFYEAKTTEPLHAHQALAAIGTLYEIEREAKPLDGAARLALRQEKARPRLETLRQWLIATKAAVLPKSPIGQATDYALSNWDALCRYTSDPRLAIDNNTAEQAVRAIALGRKNWLFLGSDNGGHAAATHFSLIASARRHGIEPFAYLRDILTRIPTHPNSQLHELLPDQWKARNSGATTNDPGHSA